MKQRSRIALLAVTFCVLANLFVLPACLAHNAGLSPIRLNDDDEDRDRDRRTPYPEPREDPYDKYRYGPHDATPNPHGEDPHGEKPYGRDPHDEVHPGGDWR
jgi:hypothetical protein